MSRLFVCYVVFSVSLFVFSVLWCGCDSRNPLGLSYVLDCDMPKKLRHSNSEFIKPKTGRKHFSRIAECLRFPAFPSTSVTSCFCVLCMLMNVCVTCVVCFRWLLRILGCEQWRVCRRPSRERDTALEALLCLLLLLLCMCLYLL